MTGDYAVFQIVQPWVEDEATWANALKDRKWANAGGDFVSKSIVKLTWPRSNGNTWIAFNVLPVIKNFVKVPDLNYGLLLRNISGAQEIVIPSSENENKELRPKLTITYEEGAAVIAPDVAIVRTGITLQTRHRDLQILANNTAPEVFVTIVRPDGRTVFNGSIPAGCSRSLTGLGAGIYLITLTQSGRTERTTVSIVP